MNLRDTPWMQQARQYWALRSVRERQLLAGAGVLTLIVGIYAGIWRPVSRDIDVLRRAVPEARAQLATMQQQAAAFTPSQARAGNGGSMIASVEQQLRDHQLQDKVSRLDGDGEKRLKLELASAPFDATARLIATLENSGIDVTRAEIDRADEPGIVQVKLELTRP